MTKSIYLVRFRDDPKSFNKKNVNFALAICEPTLTNTSFRIRSITIHGILESTYPIVLFKNYTQVLITKDDFVEVLERFAETEFV